VATISTLGLLASDVAYGLLDPRVRDAQRRIGEGRA
jgi:ABC-type dipeptide/oligopeptide/nickel transport system permease component